ncbi:antibiotic biosynthesis monooxygenase [Rhizobium wenxiniae]|jgi:heme-degrading monooxygenase HmoA|uniref:Heme-degrading monooxygenase HmoA n=1 Tax=Rhizobium wenxiniae TaxID=1737357 RepID=A0A7X0CYW3_9HYPH|nr:MULTISPECIES: antibiotic biosynthesis monooxygenase [Rhizobium/Agrobacterium group]MBB6161323.1 heme-degrading monooxygenase HmoA [Rhizobium wenxiniae]MBO0139654.1 antibiotic biosynthesis monooxygenase [Agrobacterium sp. Ap1]MBW9086268.1 antibiotic biosynthesis monooxygenase [Rhizobium wenxiniae]GGF88008.1 antibiotic biosynthesis monooxygenase [Rhizobium wenxiniae]
MYIAMNRFRVVPGFEEAFEAIWRDRQGRLAELPGYIEFHMLKGPKAEDHSLYASHTVWETFEHFKAWTTSEQFRAAHANAGNNRGKVEYLSGPHFEGFEVIIHEDKNGVRAADAA